MRRLLGGLALAAALVAGCGRNAADPHVTVSPDHPDAVCAPAGPRPSNGLNCYLGEPGANPHRDQTNLGDDAIGIALIQPDTPNVSCPPTFRPPNDVCILNPSGVPIRAMVTSTPQAETPSSPLCPTPYVPGFRCSVEDGKLVVAVASN